jgi:hypothetical protein
MAPEQALGGEIGPQTDLFTCGAMLFEMLTGTRLIAGESLGEAFQNVMKYKPPDLTPYVTLIPDSIRPLLAMLLERDPARRPVSAAEVKIHLLTRASEPPVDIFAIADYVAGTERVQPATDIILKARRHSKLWAFAGAGLLLVFLLGLWAAMLKDAPQVAEKPILPKVVDTTELTPITPKDTTISTVPGSTRLKDSVQVKPNSTQQRDSIQTKPTEVVAPQVPVGPAYATLTSTPWSKVFYNDSLLGITPLMTPIALPAGNGTLLFLNDEIKLPVSRQLNLVAGETTEVAVNLQDYLARIRIASVRPWADVYIDGQLKFRTPSSQTLFLSLGKHTLELRHPDLPHYYKELVFDAKDPIYEVRVDLSKL